MIEEEQKLADEAVAFVLKEKQKLFAQFADPAICQPTNQPISLFMAGSPGAGKTEVSKRLIARFDTKRPIRIDADDIRAILPGYTGANAHIFQKACSKGVDKLHDYAIDHNINIIMDSTFSSSETLRAIERSIKHGRKIEIYYLYQDRVLAWKFTQAREVKEGRRISKEVFIRAFLRARENVNAIKTRYKEKIELNVIIKDFEQGIEDVFPNVEWIDEYLKKIYDETTLNNLLSV